VCSVKNVEYMYNYDKILYIIQFKRYAMRWGYISMVFSRTFQFHWSIRQRISLFLSATITKPINIIQTVVYDYNEYDSYNASHVSENLFALQFLFIYLAPTRSMLCSFAIYVYFIIMRPLSHTLTWYKRRLLKISTVNINTETLAKTVDSKHEKWDAD